MRFHVALLAAGVALAAGQTLAEGGPQQAEIDVLVAAIAAAGCIVNEANRAAVLKASGLTADVAVGIVQRLSEQGLAVEAEGSHALRLKTGGCK